ncbi:MAG: RNA polymerase sigma factor [Geminicoccaceae bacterium]
MEEADPDKLLKRALVRLLPQLRRFCLAITASYSDADDLCQSTCERAITRLDRWTPGTRLDSWLYRIAQNLHKNTVRDRGNRLRILEEQSTTLFETERDQISPQDGVEAARIRDLVFGLPQAQREVLLLICVEGHSYKECAELLDLPMSTVTNRLFQARMGLREAMASDVAAGASTTDDVKSRRASL